MHAVHAVPLPSAVARLPRLDRLSAADAAARPYAPAFSRVYEPQEDTWLLCDTLAGEAAAISAHAPALVGSGTVAVSLLGALAAAGAAAGAAAPACLVVDVNFSACLAATGTAAADELPAHPAPPPAATAVSAAASSAAFAVRLPAATAAAAAPAAAPPPAPVARHIYDALCGDLLLPLLPRLCGSVDVLLCNPPYVPTPHDEVPSAGAMAAVAAAAVGASAATPAASSPTPDAPVRLPSAHDDLALAASWAGGERGREVIDRLLPLLPRVLRRPHGVAYLLLLADNAPGEIAAELARGGLMCTLIARRRAANEELFVARVGWA